MMAKSTLVVSPRLSLVVPTYNVATYLPAFFESVFSQTSQTQRFEVIIIDDGSTDESGRIAQDWARKYPAHIRYIHQENQGLSGARNTGLKAARGAWVSFPDPDDFLDPDYFRVILEQTVVKHKKPLLMIVAKLLPYDDATQTSMDNHPLDYRFRGGLAYVDTSDMGDFIHLSAASCWFDRATLAAEKLRFNPRVKPVFEDGHLVTKLLMLSPDRTIAVAPKAVYHYRKRADASSLVMGAKTDKAFYLDALEYGYLDLMLFAKAKLGYVPRFVQRVCLYELQSRIKYLMGDDTRIDILTDAEKARFIWLLEKIMVDISLETIQLFHIGRFNNQHRIALIGRFKSDEMDSNHLYIEKYDPKTGVARFSYFTGAQETSEVILTCADRPLRLTHKSSHWTTLANARYLGQHWFYVTLPKTGEVVCTSGDLTLTVRHIKRNMTDVLGHKTLQAFLHPAPARDLSESETARRDAVLQAAQIYQEAWLLMDTPMSATGEAVALYYHLQTSGQTDRVWFVLSVLSPDWARLMSAGVRLLPYGNDAHLAALVQGNLLVTSCTDPDQHWPVDPKILADQTQIRTVLLPQPCDVPKSIADYLCVPASATQTALCAHTQNGGWFAPDMAVTGFVRHDRLKAAKRQPKTVLIAPDWMRDITPPNGQNPLTKKSFPPTEIVACRAFWQAVFASPDLAEIKRSLGLEFHAIVGRELGKNPVLAEIVDQVIVHEAGDDTQTIDRMLAQADVLVTDQPMLAYDAAFLERQSLLCRHAPRPGDAVPLPPQVIPSDTVAALLADIATCFSPRKRAEKYTKLKPFYPVDATEAGVRITTYLHKLCE